MHNGPGIGDLHALADAVGPAAPAGIDQPDGDIMLGNSFLEQIGIDGGRQDHERGPETGAKGGAGLGDAFFGAGHFGGVAGEEMIHRLFRGEFGHRRQDAEGIAGEHDDILGMTAEALPVGVSDMADGVGGPGIFGEGVVIQIYAAGIAVKADIFQNGAETPGGLVDVGFGAGRQTDDFGITAAFDIENAMVAPAVFVIADESPGGIGREAGLAGAGEAEENGGITTRPTLAEQCMDRIFCWGSR